MTIETTIINSTKEIVLNVTSQVANHVTNHVLPNDTVNVIVHAGDPYTFWLVIATIGVGISGFVATWLSNRSTKRSIELTKLEMEFRMKPQLSLVENHHGGLSVMHENNLSYVRLEVLINNYGLSSADNYKVFYRLYLQKPNFRELIQDYSKLKFESCKTFESILPTQHTDMIRIDIKRQFDEIKTCWIVLWFEYTFLKNIPDETFFILHFEEGAFKEYDTQIINKSTIDNIRDQFLK